MLRYEYVDVKNEIIDAEISRDSTRTIVVTRVSEKEAWVKMFCFETLEEMFAE